MICVPFLSPFQLWLRPNHFAVYKVTLKAPNDEGNYAVDIRVATTYDVRLPVPPLGGAVMAAIDHVLLSLADVLCSGQVSHFTWQRQVHSRENHIRGRFSGEQPPASNHRRAPAALCQRAVMLYQYCLLRRLKYRLKCSKSAAHSLSTLK